MLVIHPAKWPMAKTMIDLIFSRKSLCVAASNEATGFPGLVEILFSPFPWKWNNNESTSAIAKHLGMCFRWFWFGRIVGGKKGTKELEQTYACYSKSKSGAAPPHKAQQKVAQHWVGTQGSWLPAQANPAPVTKLHTWAVLNLSSLSYLRRSETAKH